MKFKLKAFDDSSVRQQIEAILLSYGYAPAGKKSTRINPVYGEYKNSLRKYVYIIYSRGIISVQADVNGAIPPKVQQIIDEVRSFGIMTPAEWAEKNVPREIHKGLTDLGFTRCFVVDVFVDRKDISYTNPIKKEHVHLKLEEKEFNMMIGKTDSGYVLTPLAKKVYHLFDIQGWELEYSNSEHNVSSWWDD